MHGLLCKCGDNGKVGRAICFVSSAHSLWLSTSSWLFDWKFHRLAIKKWPVQVKLNKLTIKHNSVIRNYNNIIMYIIGTLISMHTKPSRYASYTVQLPYVNYMSQIFLVAVTSSLTLREERRLRCLRMFGPKRDEVTGEWRKLHKEELNDLYSSPNIVKVKWSCYRPGVAQRLDRGIALLFHDRGTRRGWVVSSTPRSQFTPGKDPVPILQEASPNIVRVIKSRRMRWAWHVARIGDGERRVQGFGGETWEKETTGETQA